MPFVPTLADFLTILAAAWGVGTVTWLVARSRNGPGSATVRRWPDDDRRWLLVVLGLWLIGAVTFASLAIVKHQALRSGAFDLAAHHQVVWNLAQGNWFATSIIDNVDTLLGKHFALILIPLAPFVWLWDDARLVLVLQAVALTATCVPMFLIARDRLGPRLGIAWAIVLLLYPPLLYVNQYDFREIAFAPVFIGFATWFLLRRRRWPMLAMLLAALATREEMGIMLAAFGFYLLVIQRQWRWGAALVTGGLAYTAVVTQVIMPFFAGGGGFLHLDRYAWLGSGIGDIGLTILTNPWLVITTITSPERLVFVGLLLVPLALASLLAPELLLLGLPTLGYTLLSSYNSQWDIASQYHAPLAPILVAAAIVGVARLAGRVTPRAIGLTGAVVAAALVATFSVGPAPFSRAVIAADFRVSGRVDTLHAILDGIPRGDSLALTDRLVAHASNRPAVYLYPWINSPLPPRWLVLDVLSGDVYPFLTRQEFDADVRALRTDGRYAIVDERDGFLVLRLDQP